MINLYISKLNKIESSWNAQIKEKQGIELRTLCDWMKEVAENLAYTQLSQEKSLELSVSMKTKKNLKKIGFWGV